ncbi:MAG: hypothetical protein GXX91_03005 [Verrucomicrobiaceae bacterium]|nr:hypothetical protein [Verrucomicrobiaceae bacterium]
MKLKSTSLLLTALSVVLLGFQTLSAADKAAAKVTYEDDVFPILDSKCLSCHNTDEAKGGLDLASFGTTLAGGSGGAVVISEDPKSSRLYTLASHSEEPIMPPKGTKATEDELKVIAAWIAGGLLETKNSKAKKSDKPKVDFDSITATGKPEGPPAMPEHLLLEPAVVTERPNSIPALAHSPWAPILAVAGQKQILLYHSSDYDLLGVLPYPEGFPQTLSFSPNGAYLFCGGGRAGKSGNVVAWDIKTGERIIEAGKEYDIVLGGDISPDLKNAIMGGPGRLIKLWDTVAGEQISSTKKHTDWVLSAAYSPDGVIYATGDRNGGLYVWEAATGYEFYTLKGHTLAVTDLDWRADGNVLASASEDGSVMLWEMRGGTQIKKFDAHRGGVLGVDFAPDGTIATVGRDKNLKIWKGDGSAIRTIAASNDIVLSVAMSEDSKRAFTGDLLGNIKAWDVTKGTELALIDANPPPIEQQLAYSEKRIGELTGQLPKLEEGIKAVSAELTAARAQLAEADKTLAAATASQKTANAAVAKSDAAVKALTADVAKRKEASTAKSAALKAIQDALAAATTDQKSKQAAASAATAELAARETALKAASAAIAAAKTAAAKPALPPEQQKQHDALAAARNAATKAREAADAVVLAKTKEQTTLAGQLEEAKKRLAAAAGDATAEANRDKAAAEVSQIEAKAKAVVAALAAATSDLKTKGTALSKAEAAFAPLRQAAAAGAETVKKAQADLAAKTTASQQAGKARDNAKAAVAATAAALAASNTKLAEHKGKLTPAQTEASAAATALADKQKELAAANSALTAARAELKKADDLLAATTKKKEAAAAKVAAVVAKEAETKQSIAATKAELENSRFLQKKWQAAAINLTAVRETENLNDMTGKLDDMMAEETEAKKEVEEATLARTEAQSTLATAKKAVETGTLALQEKSASVLERALKLVASRAVAELREEAILGQASPEIAAVSETPPAAATNAAAQATSERKAEIGVVAAETLSYKTPEEINAEVSSLKSRLDELEQFLANTYVEATKTKSTVLAADQVARETPQVIAERTKIEEAAARELAEAEAERKRQEQALADQKKHIEELRAKYLATLPKREG